MIIPTPNPENLEDPIMKPVVINGGVKVRLAGTKYLTEATVLSINEEEGTLVVKGVGFEAEIHVSTVIDSMEPALHAYQSQYTDNLSTTHRPEGANKDWPKIGE